VQRIEVSGCRCALSGRVQGYWCTGSAALSAASLTCAMCGSLHVRFLEWSVAENSRFIISTCSCQLSCASRFRLPSIMDGEQTVTHSQDAHPTSMRDPVDHIIGTRDSKSAQHVAGMQHPAIFSCLYAYAHVGVSSSQSSSLIQCSCLSSRLCGTPHPMQHSPCRHSSSLV
jgi:hypothetical protein